MMAALACISPTGSRCTRCSYSPQMSDIDFMCVAQGTPWLRRVLHEYLGVGDTKSVEIFTRFGYLSSAMMPAALHFAEQEGQLVDGDLVVLTSGGTGMTYGAAVLRWGR